MSRRAARMLGVGLVVTMATLAPALSASAVTNPTTYRFKSPDAQGHATCFGYQGTFKAGSRIMIVRWYGTSDSECFGIARDKSIWHTWPGTGAWKRMPNGGRADDTVWAATVNNDPYVRNVGVCVYGSGYWQANNEGGTWRSWWFTGSDSSCR